MLASHDCDPSRLVPGSDLTGADLSTCRLVHDDLHGATLVDADLTGANVAPANLESADLTGADLTRTRLLLAPMAHATLTGVTWSATVCPDGTNSDSHGATCAGHLDNPILGDGSPIGAMTSVGVSGGAATVTGWALDPNTLDPLTIAVSVDGTPWSTGTADLPDPTVGLAHPLWGPNHGFDLEVGAVGPGIHIVCVIVRNVDAGADHQLGCGTSDLGVGATTYHPLAPARILDTRNGTGGTNARLGAGQTIDLDVTGTGGVPADHVGAVVLNVTVVDPAGGQLLDRLADRVGSPDHLEPQLRQPSDGAQPGRRPSRGGRPREHLQRR